MKDIKQVETELQQIYTNEVNKYFNYFIDEVITDSKLKNFDFDSKIGMTQKQFDFEKKMYDDFLNGITLIFNKNVVNGASANLYKKEINWNTNNATCIFSTLIHEFSHLAVYYFSNSSIQNHCLEFAIFNYCLLNRYDTNDFKTLNLNGNVINKNKTFFRSYDIHEDKIYGLLSINVMKFDFLIQNIKFTDLKDLYNKSVYYSKKIRDKAIQF